MNDRAAAGVAKGVLALLLCLAVLNLPIGCGKAHEEPVYDTAANPYGFPNDACELIDAVVAGRLATYDVITESFGRLYLEHNELLENRHWQEVIQRLGGSLQHRADSLTELGVGHYGQAAGFYMLAAFAQPDKSALSEKAKLLSAWKEMMKGLADDYRTSPNSPQLADRLDFLRHFVLGDSVEKVFADRYLVHQLLDSAMSGPSARHDTEELTTADRALLSSLGLGDDQFQPIATWPDGGVALIAYKFIPVGPNRFRAEFYFDGEPERVAGLVVALQFETAKGDSSRAAGVVNSAFPIDWGFAERDGRIMGIAHQVMAGRGPVDEFEFSLNQSAGGASTPITTSDGRALLRLSVLPLQ